MIFSSALAFEGYAISMYLHTDRNFVNTATNVQSHRLDPFLALKTINTMVSIHLIHARWSVETTHLSR